MTQETKFKIGDFVKCIPGFSNEWVPDLQVYGGAGYEDGKIFLVEQISEANEVATVAYFPKCNGVVENGVYEMALRKYYCRLTEFF